MKRDEAGRGLVKTSACFTEQPPNHLYSFSSHLLLVSSLARPVKKRLVDDDEAEGKASDQVEEVDQSCSTVSSSPLPIASSTIAIIIKLLIIEAVRQVS